MEKLVSIIVPVYNSEEYLEKCIDSIINQTYKNLEIILINDGSKDKSIDICKKYENKDSRIKIIDKKNEGAAATRNLGIDVSKGEYIMFVDSDDYIDKKLVEASIIQNQKNDYDVVISKVELFDDKYIETYCYYENDLIVTEKIKEELIKSIFLDNKENKFTHIEGPVAKLIKKDFITKNNIRFNTKLIYGEDLVFSLEIYTKTSNIFFVNKFLYFYRKNENSVTHSFDKNMIANLKETQQDIVRILKINNIENKYVDEVYYNRIKQFEKIVRQYFFCKKNEKKYYELKKEFIDFSNSDFVQETIKNIKKEKLHFTRKVIVFCLKKRAFFILKIYYKIRFKD